MSANQTVNFRSVFATRHGGGNLTPVFTGCEDLDNAERQTISRALGFSETVFIDDAEGMPKLSFYTPTMQVPACAHGTLAAASILFEKHSGPAGSRTVRTGAGELLLEHLSSDKHCYALLLEQAELRETPASSDLIASMNEALRTPAGEYGTIISSASISRRLLLSCKQVPLLDQIDPYFASLAPLLQAADLSGVFVYRRVDKHQIKARFFAPSIGIDEDPCNGNSSLALACHLLRHDPYTTGDPEEKEWIVRQGLSECVVSARVGAQELTRPAFSLRLSGQVLPVRPPARSIQVLNWVL